MKNKFEIGYTVSILLICSVMLFSNFTKRPTPIQNASEMANFCEYHLAFNINPTHNTGLVSYAVVGVQNGKIVSKKHISTSSFILQAMGREQSGANPYKEDFFEKNELSDCFYKYDSIKDIYVDCFTLEDLWALRYNRNPTCPSGCIPKDGMLLKGWAEGKHNPSWPQIQILQEYGIVYISDMFYGDNMFQLFKDMEDPSWVKAYIAAGTPPQDTTSSDTTGTK